MRNYSTILTNSKGKEDGGGKIEEQKPAAARTGNKFPSRHSKNRTASIKSGKKTEDRVNRSTIILKCEGSKGESNGRQTETAEVPGRAYRETRAGEGVHVLEALKKGRAEF